MSFKKTDNLYTDLTEPNEADIEKKYYDALCPFAMRIEKIENICKIILNMYIFTYTLFIKILCK